MTHAPPPTSRSASPGPTTPRRSPSVQVRTWPDVVRRPAAGRGADARRTRGPPAWRDALAPPGDARNRVLVALERNRVVGFAITSPATDPDCDPVADGELDGAHRRRRPSAARATARGCSRRPPTPCVADRFTRAVTVADRRRRRAARLPHRRRLGARRRPPRARPRRHGRHAGQAGPAAHRPGLTGLLISGAVSGTMEPAAPAAPPRRIGARAMFGPLPLLHRIMLVLVTAGLGVLARRLGGPRHPAAPRRVGGGGRRRPGRPRRGLRRGPPAAAATGEGHPPPLTPAAARVGACPTQA